MARNLLIASAGSLPLRYCLVALSGKLACTTLQDLNQLMILTYWIAASATATLIIQAFLKDSTASKFSLEAWVFVTVATLLWPITLPFIASSKLRAAADYQAKLRAEEQTLERKQPFSAV